MKTELDLSLPDDVKKPMRPPSSGKGMLWLILLVQIAAVVLLVLARAPEISSQGPELSVDQQRELALKLEKQGLAAAAAEAWEAYLVAKEGDAEKAAKIWYRVGKSYQDAGEYERALAAFYRSESFMEVDSLNDEISRRTQECLESLGKFAALRYELAERVGVGAQSESPGEEVVAEIGPTKITKVDLDRQIETAVARQLSQYAAFMPEEQLKQQKEALLKRFSSNEQRLQILNQYLAQETLVRKAREDGLAETPALREVLRQAERDILAQHVMQNEIATKVTVTPGDVEMFYKATPEAFMEPAKVQIAHILVADEEKAEAVLNSLKAGKAFEELAKEVSDDQATAEAGGKIDAWLSAERPYVPGIGQAEDLMKLAFATPVGEVAPQAVASQKGQHIIKVLDRQEPRQKTFDEVKDEAAKQLRSRREREVQEALIKDLFETYGVVMHQSQLRKADPDESEQAKP